MTESTNNPRGSNDSPLSHLLTELRYLYRRAGEPSTRRIANLTGGGISHATVNKVLRGGVLPRWGPLELVVEALGGETQKFLALWVSARDSVDLGNFEDRQHLKVTEKIGDVENRAREDANASEDRAPYTVESKFSSLDSLLGGGFGPSQLVVIGGEHSVGKSMLGLGFARASAIHQEVPALVVTFEATHEDVVNRILSAEARVQHHLLRSGELSDDDWVKLAKAAGAVSEAPLFVTDSCDHALDATLLQIEQSVAERGVRFVVVDYLQQMQLSDAGVAKQDTVRLLRAFKRLAVRLQVTIVVISQIGGMPPYLTSRFVQLLNLPDLTEFMQDADLVLLLHRDDLHDAMSPRAGEADLIVAKNRNGPRDIVTLAAQIHLCRFVDLAPEWKTKLGY